MARNILRIPEIHSRGSPTRRRATQRKNPHARYILELSRPVDRAEGIRLGMAMQRSIERQIGPDKMRFDTSVYRGEQPVYTPLQNASVAFYGGDPIDVDQVLKEAPPLEETPSRSARVAAAASSDPLVRALTDRGMIKRDHGDGKLSVACTFEAEHTEPGGESSTVYFLPNFGGVRYGKFKCLHAHCAERQQKDFIRALGLDPKEVWREQAGGPAPYHDLPPLESYDEAAQEAVQRAIAGAKAPDGDEPRPGNGAAQKGSHGNATTMGGAPPAPTFITATKLWNMQHDPTRWAVPGILPEGVAILGGKPKTGKSWLALDLAIAVGTGGRALGTIDVEAGPVLYLALEDTKRRLTKRLRILCGDTVYLCGITPVDRQPAAF